MPSNTAAGSDSNRVICDELRPSLSSANGAPPPCDSEMSAFIQCVNSHKNGLKIGDCDASKETYRQCMRDKRATQQQPALSTKSN